MDDYQVYVVQGIDSANELLGYSVGLQAVILGLIIAILTFYMIKR